MEKDREYYEGLDKRTKEYKQWKAKFQEKSKGLGDTVEKITKATGVKKVVKSVFGDDCGCDERKAKLNKMFRYKTVECLTPEELYRLDHFFNKESQSRVSYTTQKSLIAIYNRIFRQKQEATNCSSCLRSIINKLRKVYDNS